VARGTDRTSHGDGDSRAIALGNCGIPSNGTFKEPVFQAIPSILGAALALWAAVRVYRVKRTAAEGEEIFADSKARLATAIHEAEHEIESAVLLRALEVFGDSERALKWMRENNPALAGDTPIHAIQTDQERREVLDTLGRIEYGVIS
jgi:hypothetical protein